MRQTIAVHNFNVIVKGTQDNVITGTPDDIIMNLYVIILIKCIEGVWVSKMF